MGAGSGRPQAGFNGTVTNAPPLSDSTGELWWERGGDQVTSVSPRAAQSSSIRLSPSRV